MPPKAAENDRCGGLSWTVALSFLVLIACAGPMFAQAPPNGGATEPPMPPRASTPAAPMPPASPTPTAPQPAAN